jgi:hypothetical protein
VKARLTNATAKRLNWTQMELREQTRAAYPELVRMGLHPVREIQRGKTVVVLAERYRTKHSNPFGHQGGSVAVRVYCAKHPKTGLWDRGVTIRQLMSDWP